jgi:O-glycosyl hydrolase
LTRETESEELRHKLESTLVTKDEHIRVLNMSSGGDGPIRQRKKEVDFAKQDVIRPPKVIKQPWKDPADEEKSKNAASM